MGRGSDREAGAPKLKQTFLRVRGSAIKALPGQMHRSAVA